jgi:hypothetical protein
MQKPDVLTTFGQLNWDYRIKLNNKHLTPALDGQFNPADCGQYSFKIAQQLTTPVKINRLVMVFANPASVTGKW